MRETRSMIFFVIAATLFIFYCNVAVNLIRVPSVPKVVGTFGGILGLMVILFVWLGFFCG